MLRWLSAVVAGVAVVGVLGSRASAQSPQSPPLRHDPVLDPLEAIAADFVQRVRSSGFKEISANPAILVDTPPQLSMYTRKDNTIHTARWEELTPDVQDIVKRCELEANQLAVAYWRENDMPYLAALLRRFRRISDRLPDPVPRGQDAEEYFNANFRSLGSNPDVYGWYQTRMVIRAGTEQPVSHVFRDSARPIREMKQERAQIG